MKCLLTRNKNSCNRNSLTKCKTCSTQWTFNSSLEFRFFTIAVTNFNLHHDEFWPTFSKHITNDFTTYFLATLNKTNLTSTAFQENPLQWSSCNCLWKCLDSNVESYLICPPRHCPQWPPIKWGLVVKDLWKSFAILYHEHVILYLQSNYDSDSFYPCKFKLIRNANAAIF